MKVLITGGGTGGHIYPALAIAKKIKEEYKNAEILYVGTERGLESELVPKEGLKFKTIRVKGFSRKLSKDTVKSIKELFLGLNDAKKVIKEFKPDIVIGTGGYVCGPVVLLASLKKIPTLIHEQNAFPGVTNKILSKFVSKVAGSFEECKKYFKKSEKVIITGNPIRKDILTIDKEKAYQDLKVDQNKPFILCFGGSGGQKKLNDAMLRFIIDNHDNDDIQVLHVTGKRFHESFMKELKSNGIDELSSNINVVPYFFEMPKALAIADLAITSGGAITIAEVTAVGVPTILIPKAYTAENHQEYNAKALEKAGASIVILEKDLTDNKLTKTIKEVLDDKEKLSNMAYNSKKIGIIDASERIVNIIKELVP
ncbi:UDP-N-acetylglucosamine transferase MurG [Gottschalkia purinilytica]|uniref:UDP-N-acetylglucosamine--N-acetylmuramyl-(pentapeptide) pyrophosphoryl-undecaprenol N-acetylglucosamine transferase n=1 Tax=Gottschalkia purinilytica TaxID=1503 RepID=A0A0L0WEQ3_GOTPU|nr:undecaprenyldiphospho-muramoylpentapeptide beta-N-acetylglucosaminyltransferase [Gottschalkia purinilytica]KNF09921.1 UDP-N-acetylglucosamine transferase MurG [Gottschalkia purinilytica]